MKRGIDDLLPMLERLRGEGKTIVSTNGCFDLLHRGHVEYLREARKLGDILVVGINSDESVKALKGPGRPVTSAEDRAFMLESLKWVDFVFVFPETSPVAFLEKLKPKIHVKGGDYVAEKLPEYEVLRSLKSKVVILPFVEGYSTSKILRTIVKNPA